MNLTKSLVATLIGASISVSAIAQDSFSKRFYVGAAGGGSQLTPEAQDTSFSVRDDTDSGGKVMVGFDFSPRFAVELAAAELGAAGINENGVNAGTIEYSVVELSGLYHFFNLSGYQALTERRGLGAFVKLGVGAMENDSPEGIPFTRENDAHLSGGLGVEYATRIGLALRAEFEAFDQDALFSSVGLLWRFGGSSGGASDGLFTSGGGVTQVSAPLLSDDDDGDGVPNNLDDCMDTAPGQPVTPTGCAIFGGVLEGVNFASGSDRLLDEAQVVLNDAADVLLADPNLNVEVRAHTDSQGAADYNLELSKKRALSTVRYLMLRGVPSEQMTARAFGEAKPVADNDTADGREINRRVEFHVIER